MGRGILSAALNLSTMSPDFPGPKEAQWDVDGQHLILHVLLVSIDGMHAIDFH